MSACNKLQTSLFQYVKKAHKPLQLAIEDAVEICNTPEIGELKVGDLAGIRVYKFRFNRQEYLMAYRPPARDLPVEFLGIDFYKSREFLRRVETIPAARERQRSFEMNQSLTAEDLFSEIKRMPTAERVKFFSLLATALARR